MTLPFSNSLATAPRSGLALKNAIDVGAGVVDYDYRGPVGVILFNHGDTDFEIKRGDRECYHNERCLMLQQTSRFSCILHDNRHRPINIGKDLYGRRR